MSAEIADRIDAMQREIGRLRRVEKAARDVIHAALETDKNVNITKQLLALRDVLAQTS